jgi:hypothetical protein
MVKAFARFLVVMATLPVAPGLSRADEVQPPAASTLFGFLDPATGLFTPALQHRKPRLAAARYSAVARWS